MEALGTYQGLSRPAANSTSEMQKVEGIPESPLRAVTQAALPTCTTETKTDCILLVPNCSAQSKQPPNLRMPCFPEERGKKKEGVSVLSSSPRLLGESTGNRERRWLWTSGAIPDTASNCRLPELRQLLASGPLLFPPARPCQAQASGTCGPALVLLLGSFLAGALETTAFLITL